MRRPVGPAIGRDADQEDPEDGPDPPQEEGPDDQQHQCTDLGQSPAARAEHVTHSQDRRQSDVDRLLRTRSRLSGRPGDDFARRAEPIEDPVDRGFVPVARFFEGGLDVPLDFSLEGVGLAPRQLPDPGGDPDLTQVVGDESLRLRFRGSHLAPLNMKKCASILPTSRTDWPA